MAAPTNAAPTLKKLLPWRRPHVAPSGHSVPRKSVGIKLMSEIFIEPSAAALSARGRDSDQDEAGHCGHCPLTLGDSTSQSTRISFSTPSTCFQGGGLDYKHSPT